MKLDFHVHSTASDGTFAPAELAASAARGGFAALALTDHDNTDGVDECRGACAKAGVPFVAGIELSIEPGEGFDRFHLLGLGIDPSSVALKGLLKKVLDGRNGRNERIFENFHRLGIDIKPEPHGEVLARPHFARWLVDNGYAADIPEAFGKYLLASSPKETRCYEPRWRPSQEVAFRTVHEAGGLCVMAHPKYWRRGWAASGPEYQDAERELARLKDAGLDGVETRYQANAEDENMSFMRIASRLGLLQTAGSDFHGANKPTIPLGMEVSSDFAEPVLSALGIM